MTTPSRRRSLITLTDHTFYTELTEGIKVSVKKVKDHDVKLERSELTKVLYHLEQALMWLEVRRVCDDGGS